MTRGHEIRLGRVLVMTLHQAIGEELPTRADFYEHWLGPDRWRDHAMGLAPMAAVLGFLRTEGAAYGRVMARAGQLAGEWAWGAHPAWRRRWIVRLPKGWRSRVIARWVSRLVTETCPQSMCTVKVVRGECSVVITGSVFCGSRDVPAEPLCAFYAAMALSLFGCAQLSATGRMETCCAGADKTKDRGFEDKGARCTGRITVS
jgi:hypothetical protein